MATKKELKRVVSELQAQRSYLEKFDLNAFKKYLKKYRFPLWLTFKNLSEYDQMAVMCKQICSRTDMLNTDAYKKSVEWLKTHNMGGRIM